ncbi:MAG TPA: hypothetical protein O0W90_00440 [Methanocorpusculum sp.]|nr:hypothetical protein [Methanocorpusculum sp.]
MRTDWILDIVIGVTGIIIFAFMMLFLPKFLPPAFGYLAAFLIFVAYMTIMGLTVVKNIIGKKPAKK